MTILNKLAESIIVKLQQYIAAQGFRPVMHFELEGCYQKPDDVVVDYARINQELARLDIDGEIVAEYWSNQWEYVSKFNGQSPLKEAQNLNNAIHILPSLFSAEGVNKTLIKPVVWAGDHGKLAFGCENIFSIDSRIVHIPNAVQINISLQDENSNNVLVSGDFAERLQQQLMYTSFACSLLYLPEEEAFERLALKSKYGLAKELCSPVDISGGHQGSIALYRNIGKHNQKMGLEPLLVDDRNNVLLSKENWHKTARIEHRLGASSIKYNPFLNIIYALLNIIDTLDGIDNSAKSQSAGLPDSLFDKNGNLGAITLFANNDWFSRSIDRVLLASANDAPNGPVKAISDGKLLQQYYLEQFQTTRIVF